MMAKNLVGGDIILNDVMHKCALAQIGVAAYSNYRYFALTIVRSFRVLRVGLNTINNG